MEKNFESKIEEKNKARAEIDKSAFCYEALSENEIADFATIIKFIKEREEEGKKDEKIEWAKIMLPHVLGRRFEKLLENKGIDVMEVGETGGMLKPEGIEWIAEKKDNEPKSALKLHRAIKINKPGEHQELSRAEVVFDKQEIKTMTDKLLAAIDSITEQDLEKIKQK